MPYSGTAPRIAVALVSVAQLLPCGRDPTQAYEAFAEKAAEGKCASVYNALDADSKTRLTTYLALMVDMAFAAHDQAAGDLPPLSEYSPGPQPLPAVTAALAALESEAHEHADAGVAEATGGAAGARPEPGGAATPVDSKPTTEKANTSAAERAVGGLQDETGPAPTDPTSAEQEAKRAAVQALRELRGKALWKALCQPEMPPLSTLFREAGIADFVPAKTHDHTIEDDRAELPVDLGVDEATWTDAKRKKAKQSKTEAQLARPVIQLVKERRRWRLVLEPMTLRWYVTEDGRRVARFNSPILSLGVEPDGERTPARAYRQVVDHVRKRECERFYTLLDSASQARMERVVPMMIGFASALGSAATDETGARDGRSLVIAMCQQASLGDLQASGLHLGTVIDQALHGNRAVLTVQSGTGGETTREVLMVREAGEWRLSIDAFAGPTPPPVPTEDDEEDEG